ncbi:MAG: hypothetical protein PHF89_06115 [Eubacteriales bacterium]|jgi:tRNA uridine 5-carbamoylmethylation protein Kti12|nr:hypothetical protein [Eubacteriales bacterium]
MITIITGHFGSGKTEFAINLALAQKADYIIDLDIVNPFFRTKDAAEKLESHGIKLISPEFANTNIDMPTLPSKIHSALQSGGNVVIDVGGDDSGAVALGQFSNYIKDKPYEMIFVINKFRPLTSNAEDVISLLRSVEEASRLKVTHLVNTSNTKNETTSKHLTDGQLLVDQVSKITEIPVKCAAGRGDIIKKLEGKLSVPLFPLALHLILPWERGV